MIKRNIIITTIIQKNLKYLPDDFEADYIPKLFKSLKEDFPFYSSYKEIVGSIINKEERELVIEFMAWFKNNENISGSEIYNSDVLDNAFSLSPLENLALYIQSHPMSVIPDNKRDVDEKLELVRNAMEKFTTAAQPLLKRRKGKPVIEIDDEYDVQDILHVILKPHFPSIKAEEVVSGVRSGHFLKIDFIIPSNKMAIECKCVRDAEHAKSLEAELNDDIQTYKNHRDCDYLIFFIYDKNLFISDPHQMEEQYTQKQTFGDKVLHIELKIRPKN